MADPPASLSPCIRHVASVPQEKNNKQRIPGMLRFPYHDIRFSADFDGDDMNIKTMKKIQQNSENKAILKQNM
jgi:hypothetical protein